MHFYMKVKFKLLKHIETTVFAEIPNTIKGLIKVQYL